MTGMPPRVPLRSFQQTIKQDIQRAWSAGQRNVLAVSATGSGKTVLFSDIILDEPGAVCAIAHRQELVSQISLALARNGVRHRIVGSAQLSRICSGIHLFELGVNYIDANSRVAVASVKTLIGKGPNVPSANWFKSVTLWVMDEAHHVLKKNQWGEATAKFPNARGLGVTATPCRADGCGLGVHASGVFNSMVIAPGMRDIINMGYLTDYRVFVPPSDLDLSEVEIGSNGELRPSQVKEAVGKSHLTGDVVKHYLRIAEGKLGITFAIDIEEATNIAKAFRDAGVPAEVISSKTPDDVRMRILRKFKNREILQLVNVDLFGEGFDLPAIEVVSMARPTESFSLYAQQFGRALRLLLDGEDSANFIYCDLMQRLGIIARSRKSKAIIIDHVGNVFRHGLPDKRCTWSLDDRDRRSMAKKDEDVIDVTRCTSCAQIYERVYAACPHCGHAVEPALRSGPEFVDGDLLELSPEALAARRGDIDLPPTFPYHAEPVVINSIKKRHGEQQQAQKCLREIIAWWAGWHKSQGRDDSYIYRLFYLTYGTDIIGAQALGTKEANTLAMTLANKLVDLNVNMAYA